VTQRDERPGAVGLAVTAAMGFAVGVLGGMLLGGSVGFLHADRVRDALNRLRHGDHEPAEPAELEDAVREALRSDEATSDLDVAVHAVGPGLIELTGVTSDALVRRAAADIARAVPGVEVVVNRILVRGTDLPRKPVPSGPARG
jgi:osmotically-inducible protein OsmY